MTTRILLVILAFPLSSYSQEVNPNADSTGTSSTLMTAAAYTSGYYAGSMFILGKTWYKDRDIVPFHFYNDNAAYLQVDKLGHMFGAYVYSYIGYHAMRNAGFTRRDALLFGSTIGFVLQSPIEIMDGIHEGYGFSWGDMAANAMGSALVLGQELLFDEQIVKYKFSYWESRYSDKANGYLGTTTLERLLTDYNGHTYWLSCPINSLLRGESFPPWFNLAVGYGANGMYGEFENLSHYNGVAIPQTIRYRQYLLSLDVDWSRIETDSWFLKIILQGLTFFKLPFPALEYNSAGEFRWYWLYF